MSWLALPQIKWVVPFPLLLAIAPLIWLFFRGSWRLIDEEALVRALESGRVGGCWLDVFRREQTKQIADIVKAAGVTAK